MNLLIASRNKGKITEFKAMLEHKFNVCIGLDDAGIDADVEETGTTNAENAEIKADFIRLIINEKFSRYAAFAVLADDTGLCVDALDGAPGVRTARFAGENATDAENRTLLLRLLAQKKNRSAHFETALVLALPDGKKLFANGKIHGEILSEERGTRGFGYDSVFCSDALKKSFAEATLEEKDAVSHRALALKNLLSQL